jgi:Ribonuclease G/E
MDAAETARRHGRIIIRTAGVGRSAEELQWDLDYLLQLWKRDHHRSRRRPVRRS